MPDFDWPGLFTPTLHPLETVLRAVLVFLFAQVVLRLVGRKELSRYAAFDVVLLFLLSTALRQTLVADDQSVTTGFLSLATLGGMDWLFAYGTYRSRKVARFLLGPTRELVRDGELNRRNLRRTRISDKELYSSLREHGKSDLKEVAVAHLEPDGKLSFQFKDDGEAASRH
jgi:uncharacterized membrane protein YcaP (DUF421 family)